MSYESVKEKILNSLVNRPFGTKIYPTNHQDYELEFLEYVKSLESISSSSLMGCAEENTIPAQPNDANVFYISLVKSGITKNYINFRNSSGESISITTSSNELRFVIFNWNKNYWSHQSSAIDFSDFSSDINKSILDLQNQITSVTEPLGFIAHSAPEPTPMTSGYYEFNTSGNCSWITTGEVTVKVGDKVSVKYTSPNEYIYKHIPVTQAEGGGGSAGVLNDDLTVNLSGGKTWGTLTSGTTIAAGTTYDALFRRALVESIPPTANVTASGSIPYNASSAILTLALSSNANNAGATIDSFVLSYKRDGAWIELYNGVPITTYSHSVDLSTDKTSSVTYRLVVRNTLTLSYTATSDIVTPAGYSAPTASGAITITKEVGDVSHRLVGSISQTSQNGVAILTRELQYSLNNSTWVAITTFNADSFDYTHNDSSLRNSTIIYYRILVTCTSATDDISTPISMGSVGFVYKSTFGYSASLTPTLATLLSMGNSVLTNNKAKTIIATAGVGEYTYYSYNSSAGDLTGIVMDGVAAVLGAFTKQSDITGVNSFGATVTYRIYKSNAPKAFTNNQLVIS